MSIRSSFLRLMFSWVSLLVASTAFAETASEAAARADYETIKNLIWEKELAINAARPVSGSKDYIAAASDSYVAWSLGGQPAPISKYREIVAKSTGLYPNQEKLELFFEGFALEDDTAIIYYSTHRTRLGDGTEVDQRYHVGHVWERDDADGEWKMLGSMIRQPPQETE